MYKGDGQYVVSRVNTSVCTSGSAVLQVAEKILRPDAFTLNEGAGFGTFAELHPKALKFSPKMTSGTI